MIINWGEVDRLVNYEDVCRIPVVDYGMNKLSVETVAGLFAQPNTLIPRKGNQYYELLRWGAIDKDLICNCRCKEGVFDWATVRRNINNISKHAIGKHFVELTNLSDGERAVKLTYFHKPGISDIPDECKIRGYIKLPRLLVPIILKSCDRKIDFAVYLIICNHYNGINRDRRIQYIPLSPKKISLELSYSEDEICEAITRLKNIGLLKLQDEYVVYDDLGYPVHYRNIKVRELREWVSLKLFGYNFKDEQNTKLANVYETKIKLPKYGDVELMPKISKPNIPVNVNTCPQPSSIVDSVSKVFEEFDNNLCIK